jgi:hypothetical protein
LFSLVISKIFFAKVNEVESWDVGALFEVFEF